MERVVGWATVAVVVTVTVSMLLVVQTTTCLDAVPGAGTSSCTTEPMIGVAGTWVAAVTGAVVLAVCVWQIVRAVRPGRVPKD
ncbi:hypothetical protein K0028_04790 [Curtobacterium flaccumfaciens pv. flaccumfaciens]|uniref:hypothetical protein n=1 Tax=Curtobacterium flaccumfaciens TaxID=2035 RepID=UPI0021B11D8D|nr:hypothetical protein [Curtobacterium flaccumfaciens]QYI98244.1 hypothetical protein K0028_04790 [Curtobacterium flaccumfaciens pv. flaccumfaciens]